MHNNIQLILTGAVSGALLALLAIGIMIEFKSSKVLNIAHGSIAALAAYIYIRAEGTWEWSKPAAFVLGVLVATLVSAVFQLIVIRALRTSSPLARLIATLGLTLLVTAVIGLAFGYDALQPVAIGPEGVYELPFGDPHFVLGKTRVWFALGTVALSVLLWAMYRFTRFGRATRASAENLRATEMLGYSSQRLELYNWALAGMLAGVAGILLASITPPTVSSYTGVLLTAIAVALIAGFQSFWLMVVVAMILGAVQAVLLRYSDALQELTHMTGWATAVPLLLVVVIVSVRGTSIAARGGAEERSLPQAKAPRHPARYAVILVAVGVIWYVVAPDQLVDSSNGTLIGMLLALSVVVITGYAGQVSLCQLALAGFGGFAAAKFASDLGWPFPLPVVVGGLAAAGLAILIGLPLLRVRGLYFAVATLAFAMAMDALFFSSNSITGADAGLEVGGASFLGIQMDGLRDPRSFGVALLIITGIAAYLIALVRRGGIGRRFLAVRANERGAAAVGISVMRTKVTAFALAGFIAGMAGSLQGYRTTHQNWQYYAFDGAIGLIAFIYMAGVGSIAGAIVAGFLLPDSLLGYLLNFQGTAGEWFNVFASIGVIVTICVHPDGVTSVPGQIIRAIRRRSANARSGPDPAVASMGNPAASPADSVVADLSSESPVAVNPEKIARFSTAAAVDHHHLAATSAILEASSVTVRFGGVLAVSDVSLTVTSATIHGLIGPNGAGKSTLVDAITGFAATTSGLIRLDGIDISELHPHARARAGLARTFQNLELFDELTVKENLRAGMTHSEHIEGWSDLIPAMFGLSDSMDSLARDLSHGRRSLVSIARALGPRPKLLLLDEPAAGLSDSETEQLGQIMRDIVGLGVTLVLVEHDMSLVTSICDTVTVLESGRLLTSGATADVIANEDVRRVYLGEVAV